VTEIAAVGAAAVFVPFPFAVDDHQTTNAKFLVDAGGGWLVQQRDLTPEWLADLVRKTSRPELIRLAVAAKSMEKTTATAEIVKACEELAMKGAS
jgi:UDP-N-acetylglucosamine--N-acetylmuramyl-(pentapeptide) pyrophosphoryl-undecaprenol N-acetylglucosamine transferase